MWLTIRLKSSTTILSNYARGLQKKICIYKLCKILVPALARKNDVNTQNIILTLPAWGPTLDVIIRRQIMTSKVDSHTVRVNVFIIAIDP